MTQRERARPGALLLCLAAAAFAACSSQAPTPSPARAGARSTSDARVRSFVGRAPPDVLTNGTWTSRAGPTSLAALRGRVVYLQFAFPQ